MTYRIMGKLKQIFIPCAENRYKPWLLESDFLLYYFLCLMMLKLLTIGSFIYVPQSALFADLTSKTLIEMTNLSRESQGLSSLSENQKLSEAAYLKAKDMVLNNYFGHVSPAGRSPWSWILEENYAYKYAGENLAIGFVDSEEVFTGWESSAEHRANILDSRYIDTGIAVVKGNFNGNETYVVVQLFASPAPKSLVKTNTTNINQNNNTAIPINTAVPSVTPTSLASPSPVQTVEPSPQNNNPQEIIQNTLKYMQGFRNEDSLTFRLSQFMVVGFNDIVQKIIIYSIALITFILFLDVFIRIDIQHRDIIFKTFFIIILLGSFAVMDKIFIISQIPHYFRIR